MAENIISSVVGKLAEYAIGPLLRQFNHMIYYNSKIRSLRDEKRALETEESKVRESVRQAKNNMQDIIPVVENWLQNVDKIKKEADEIFEGATNSEMQCLFLRCPNLKNRHSLGRKATWKTKKVAELLKEGNSFQNVAEPRQPVQIPSQNPGDFGDFETRIPIKEEIMDALKDKDVSIIGICGMGGVGKTTMAREIANEAKIDKLFDEFAWAEVSQDPDVTKIQDKLADNLGLKIKDCTDKDERAELLRKRLGGGRSKSILVILDDVWEDTVLETIGVPSGGDDKGLKILLTSRDKDVCRKMRAQRIFDVHLLNEKESWELFKEKAEISDDATNVIKDTAENIAKECDGLPLALVIVGRALCRKEEHVWKNALVELRSSAVTNIKGVHKFVYSRIELSYNYLESGEAKSLFQLCSLYPEDCDIAIEDLVRYAWGLGLFRGTTTLIATRDRVKTIVDHLKSCYLLLSAEDKDRVRLHDVVRDVCLQIASKDNMSKHSGLKEWPKHDNNESYGAISLTSDELNQLPSGLEYPNLKFLKVTCNQQLLNISKEFFADMKELRVLDFTDMWIQIPSSIQMLTNLRTLCLDHCTLKIENSTIGNLKKLEVLSFWSSALDHFPEDIAGLSNLRSLDLRFKHSCSYCPLLHGILSQLKKLEELYLGVVEIKDDELERGYIIKEISLLAGLNTFQISTHDPQFLLQILRELCIEKLEIFHIELTDLEYARRNIGKHYYFRRRLHLRGITYASMLSEPEINSLMRRTDHLSIEMHLNNLDDLSQHVTERKKDGFECLNENHPTGAFDGLQEVNISMPKMKYLFGGVNKPPSLHNLKNLTIGGCPSLKSLFSESVASCVVNLRSLTISHCEMLEEVISMDTEQIEVTQMLEFPKLQSIILEDLRNFKSFRCGSNKTVGVLNPLFKQVTLPNLESLDIEELGCTVTILDELRRSRSHKLRQLKMAHLDDVSILFDFEYTKDDTEIRILGQLTSLDVMCLPKLVHITRMFPKGICIFKSLERLNVQVCDNLRYLFSPSMANSLAALRKVSIWACKAIEEIIGRQEEDDTSNVEMVEEGTTSRIVFPKLRNLILVHLDRFRLLSSLNYELVFPSLDYLLIKNCPMMTKLCSRQSAPKLDKVWIDFGQQSIDIANFLDIEGSIHTDVRGPQIC